MKIDGRVTILERKLQSSTNSWTRPAASTIQLSNYRNSPGMRDPFAARTRKIATKSQEFQNREGPSFARNTKDGPSVPAIESTRIQAAKTPQPRFSGFRSRFIGIHIVDEAGEVRRVSAERHRCLPRTVDCNCDRQG